MMEKDDLESRIAALEAGHRRNRDRIQQNRGGIRASLAVLVFTAIVFGYPLASVRWRGYDDFEFTRDTASPELVIIGGLAAASLFLGDDPKKLIRAIIDRNRQN